MPEPWNELPLPDLYAHLARTGLFRRLLELARDEDLGPSLIDLTGSATALRDAEVQTARVALVAREPGVLAGLAAVSDLLYVFGVSVRFESAAADGSAFSPGDRLALFTGPLADLVKIERTILNLVSRLSGIATRTASFVRAMESAGNHNARLYDTRKTTPGLRLLEKYAVRCGGGHCHRMGLHDAVMFKDNHIAGVAAPDLGAHARQLVERAHAAARDAGITPAFIEFEVDSLDQLDALLSIEAGVIDTVLLDNMPPAELLGAVAKRDTQNPSLALEASGGVGLETISAIAATGVDRISVGGLTHQAVSVDLGFDAGVE